MITARYSQERISDAGKPALNILYCSYSLICKSEIIAYAAEVDVIGVKQCVIAICVCAERT